MNDEVLEAYGQRQLDEYSHWVHQLQCYDRFHCNDYQELKERAKSRIGREPEWLRMAWEANRVIYIGQTENLQKRLGQHYKNKMSSDFTNLFEPCDIRYIEPCHSRNRAEYREQKLGKSYYDNENVYAYWN